MIGALVLLLAGQANGSPPAPVVPPALSADQRAAARRLLVATGAPERRGPLIDDVFGRVTIFLRCRTLDPTGRQECTARERMYANARREVEQAKSDLVAAIADVQERAYAAHLTIADMDAVATFAATEAGRHFFAAAKPAGDEAYLASNILILDRINAILDRAAVRLPHPATVTDSKP